MSNEPKLIGNFRLAFPSLFKPTPKSKDHPEKLAYQATMVFQAGDPALMDLRKMIKAAIVEKWGEDKVKWPPVLRSLDIKTFLSMTGKDGFPLRDGATVNWAGAGPGTVVVKASANADYPPKVVDQKKDDIIDKSKILSGMVCRAVVKAFAYDRPDSKGVSFSLNIVQLVKDDGVRFGGGDNSQYLDQLGAIEGGEDDPKNYQDDDL